MADYLALLVHSYAVEQEIAECAPATRAEYLADYIFNFTTYDGDVSAEFGQRAVDVCAAINDRRTFEYIKDPDNYRWYLLMCNMPFFAGRLEWGTSIRGAWWDRPKPLDTCGLWDGDKQLCEPIEFTPEEWTAFIAALVNFATPDTPNA